MSPTALFDPRDRTAPSVEQTAVVGGGVPGVGSWWVGREGYTGTQAQTLPRTIFSLNLASGPTHGQMKAFLEV